MKQYFKFTRLFSEAMVKEVLKGLSENSNINKRVLSYICRSSRPKVFRKKGVLRNFTKFTGKLLCQSLFFNKLIKKETLAQVFFCEFCEISKNTFFLQNTSAGCFFQYQEPIIRIIDNNLNKIYK